MENTATVLTQEEIEAKLKALLKEDLTEYDVIDNTAELLSSKKYDVSFRSF
jgi:hypothetical protein